MSKRPETGPSATLDGASPANETPSGELTAVVDELLGQLSNKFSTISSELLSKMDDMSRRLDNLEATIQAGETTKSDGPSK